MARGDRTPQTPHNPSHSPPEGEVCGDCPVSRYFIADSREIRDESGFLDTSRTPQMVRLLDLLERHPVSVVIGDPWLGKTTVANQTAVWLLTSPAVCGFDGRVTLTRLGTPGTERALEPAWWGVWRNGSPQPACWLLDGWDEGEDRTPGIGEQIAEALVALPEAHRLAIRVLLLSRPRPELDGFLGRLREPFGTGGMSGVQLLRLARLDRAAALEFVGAEQFERVLKVIRANSLQQVAGFPSVLRFLSRHASLERLTIPDVWRGILRELLEDPALHRRTQLKTSPDDRLCAASRAAAILLLTQRDELSEYDPDPTVPTATGLFPEENGGRLRAACAEALRFPVFVRAPEDGVFRFAHRNIRDWLAAFGLAAVPPRSLRAALAGPDGNAFPRFREMLTLLRRATTNPETVTVVDAISGGVTLPGGGIEPSLQESLRCVAALEVLATRSVYGLRLGPFGHEEYTRLNAEGLGAALADRLRAPTSLPAVRELWLEIAYATDAVETAEPALAIALDAALPESLRIDAMMVACLHGGDAHLAPLSGFAETPSENDITERIRAMLILELVRRRIWDRPRAIVHAPPAHPRIGDARGMLIHYLEKEMTVADARQVLPHLTALYQTHRREALNRQEPPLVSRVISLLRDATHVTSADRIALTEAVLALTELERMWGTASSVLQRFRADAAVRQRFFDHEVARWRSGTATRPAWCGMFLDAADWDWLATRAAGDLADYPEIWAGLYWLAFHDRERTAEGKAAWRKRLARIKKAQPSVVPNAEAARIAAAQRDEELQVRERVVPPVPDLSTQVGACLADTVALADRKMRFLGGVCFEPFGSPRPVRGRWEDLSENTQSAVLAACRCGLETAVPTTSEDPCRYTNNMLSEGKAFAAVVRAVGGPQWLTGQWIGNWLPVALYVPLGTFPADLVRACWAVDEDVAGASLRAFVTRELSSTRSAARLHEIPVECWTSNFAEFVAGALANATYPPEGRRWTLELLAARSPALALPIARQWAGAKSHPAPEDQLRLGGLNALLMLDPPAALDVLETGYVERGSVAVEEAAALWERRLGNPGSLAQWAVADLGRLMMLLQRAYPLGEEADEDEDGEVRPMADADQLRLFRNQLFDGLLRAKTPEANAIVDALANESPAVRNWAAAARAADEARAVLGAAALPGCANGSAIGLASAIRVLDSATYRLIRSEDDLLDVILDVLRDIESDVAADLPMLYGAPPKGGGVPPKAAAKAKKAAERKHLHEDALQAYLRRRLCDLLPARAEGVKVEVHRENQIQYRRRLDLLVLAPCLDRRELAAVVVEVKWSDNVETESSLTEQLGKKYLLKEGRTHGIYLVGWAGKWKQNGKTKSDRAALVSFLVAQRDRYRLAAGKGLRIEPVTLGLTWRDPTSS